MEPAAEDHRHVQFDGDEKAPPDPALENQDNDDEERRQQRNA